MLKLHLGCGSNSLEGWVNVDIESPIADLIHDLRQPLPFPDGSVDRIFAEHMIEHIEYEEAIALIRECRRVLVPGGVVRVTTPDLVWLVTNYAAAVTDRWGELWQPRSPCALLNEGMRSWGHKYLYDRADLRALFHDAGFVDVVDCDWRESIDPELSGLESRPFNREIIFEARLHAPVSHTNALKDLGPLVPGKDALGELLISQGRELERLRRERQAANGVLGGRDVTIAAMAEVSAHQSARAARLEEEARGLREVVADRESIIASHVARLQEMQGGIVSLESSIEDLVRVVRGLEGGIAEKDGLVEALKTDLSRTADESTKRGDFILVLNRKLAELEQLLGERAVEVERLTSESAECAVQIESSNAEIERLQAGHADIARENADLRASIDALQRRQAELQSTWLGRFALRRIQR